MYLSNRVIEAHSYYESPVYLEKLKTLQFLGVFYCFILFIMIGMGCRYVFTHDELSFNSYTFLYYITICLFIILIFFTTYLYRRYTHYDSQPRTLIIQGTVTSVKYRRIKNTIQDRLYYRVTCKAPNGRGDVGIYHSVYKRGDGSRYPIGSTIPISVNASNYRNYHIHLLETPYFIPPHKKLPYTPKPFPVLFYSIIFTSSIGLLIASILGLYLYELIWLCSLLMFLPFIILISFFVLKENLQKNKILRSGRLVKSEVVHVRNTLAFRGTTYVRGGKVNLFSTEYEITCKTWDSQGQEVYLTQMGFDAYVGILRPGDTVNVLLFHQKGPYSPIDLRYVFGAYIPKFYHSHWILLHELNLSSKILSPIALEIIYQEQLGQNK